MEKLKLIGSGAYANVYSFIEPLTKRKFAKKKLKTGSNEKEIERFKREFDIMHKFSNPYILKAYSFNTDENSYIMDYCDCSLKDYINKNNNKEFMNFEFRKNIALQLLSGLRFLHSKKVLHRDLSCNNILVEIFDDNIIRLKISDFGLEKDEKIDITSTDSTIKGTIIDDTLSSFKDYNIKNEIYVVGVILCFIFTGKSNVNIEISNVSKIVNKCVTRNHDDRYNNVDEIIEDVKSLNDMSNKVVYTESNKISSEENLDETNLNVDECALQILKAMSEDTGGNRLYYIKSLSGNHIQTSDGKFSVHSSKLSPREKAIWKSAFNKLVKEELISALSSKNEIFEITAEGYEYLDKRKENFVVQVI